MSTSVDRDMLEVVLVTGRKILEIETPMNAGEFLQALDARIKDHSAERDKLAEQVNALMPQLRSVSAERDKLEKQLRAASKDRDFYHQNASQWAEVAAEMESERDSLKAEVEERKERVRELIRERQHLEDCNERLAAENAGRRTEVEELRKVVAAWTEFMKEVEVAEDRSNLDGDDAEAVLEQLNNGAEEMLKLSPSRRAEG